MYMCVRAFRPYLPPVAISPFRFSPFFRFTRSSPSLAHPFRHFSEQCFYFVIQYVGVRETPLPRIRTRNGLLLRAAAAAAATTGYMRACVRACVHA